MKSIFLTGEELTIEDVVLIAHGKRHSGDRPEYPKVIISPEAAKKLLDFRNGLQKRIDAEDIMYGVNTGCGSQKAVVIPRGDVLEYQKRYIPAHSTGFGDPYPEEVTRAAMVLRVNSFVKGNSGITLELCEKILELLNKEVIPIIPEKGSVGSSGDLCPLAHLGALMIGLPEQNAWYKGKEMPGRQALYTANIDLLELRDKEAMGLTNGATFSLANAVISVNETENLLKNSNLVFALSMEALRGCMDAMDIRVHAARNHNGQCAVTTEILKALKGSTRVTDSCRDICLPDEKGKKVYFEEEDGIKKPKPRVQDAYSFRCHPQVAGSVLETLEFVRGVVTNEINASTDNPLIFKSNDGEYEVLSAGNFHGEPIAHACDYLKIAVQSLANISNSRFYAMLSPHTSYGLPPDLSGKNRKDLNTGLMILQYSVAALVSENKVLCHPASVDSIPTSSGQEDYVSMAPISARHLRQVINNTYGAIAAELIAASQAIDLTSKQLKDFKLGKGTKKLMKAFRNVVTMMTKDRYLHTDWVKATEFLRKN